MTVQVQIKPQQLFNNICAQLMRQDLPKGARHYVVACFPKSGSTYLTTILAKLIGREQVHLVPEYGHREQELSPAYLAVFHEEPYVAQHHLKCSAATLEMFGRFSIYPVVQVRNLFDVAFSMIDHLDKIPVTPVAYVPGGFAEADAETKFRFFAEMMAPWYISFFVSWVACDHPRTWVTYEDLIGDEVATVGRICAGSGWEVGQSEIERAVAAAQGSHTRRNKGVAGRGEALPEDVKDRLRALTRFYPSVDFSPIGL